MNNPPLKIGYVMQADSVDLSTVSGPQLHVTAVVRGLERRGHQVRMLAIQKGKTVWSDDLNSWHPASYGFSQRRLFRLVESSLRGVQSRLRLPFLRLFDSYRFSEAAANAFQGYDLLYERFGLLSYGGLLAARRLNIPIVLEINGDLEAEYEQLGIRLSAAQAAIIRRMTRWMFQKASRLVAVGETIKQRIVRRYRLNPEHVIVVTNGVDVASFQHPCAQNVPDQYKIPVRPTVIFIGSFQPWHGVDLILEAFALMAASQPCAILLLVGDGLLRSEMERKAAELKLGDRVMFTGMVAHQEVAVLLEQAQVAVIYHRLSAAEIVETPLKLFEYMAAGKAIIAPDVPNMRRVLSHGVNALLVPPESPALLAEAMQRLLNDEPLRTALGQAARREALQKHSWERVVSDLEKIFYELTGKAQGEKTHA